MRSDTWLEFAVPGTTSNRCLILTLRSSCETCNVSFPVNSIVLHFLALLVQWVRVAMSKSQLLVPVNVILFQMGSLQQICNSIRISSWDHLGVSVGLNPMAGVLRREKWIETTHEEKKKKKTYEDGGRLHLCCHRSREVRSNQKPEEKSLL